MSEAREKYYEELNLKNMITHGAANKYIAELEHQITELKTSQKQKQIIKLCNRLDKAEQQNKQMIEALDKVKSFCVVHNYLALADYIEFVTGKKIEEVIK